jgi:hypothetical protein
MGLKYVEPPPGIELPLTPGQKSIQGAVNSSIQADAHRVLLYGAIFSFYKPSNWGGLSLCL